MKHDHLIKSLFAAVLLCIGCSLSAQGQAKTMQGQVLVTLSNGQAVNPTVGLTPEELKGGLVVHVAEGVEILRIYQVRGSRPLRSKTIRDQQELQHLDLNRWLAGKEGVFTTDSSAITRVDVRKGDRIMFRAQHKGQEFSCSYDVR
jgi:hypothetical protein